jgi:hypothetical protein
VSADIDVKESKQGSAAPFEVAVSDGRSTMSYRVTIPEKLYQKLTQGKMTKSDCVKAAFRFLLDREPKESILKSFDLPLISRYFPEFESEFKNYT